MDPKNIIKQLVRQLNQNPLVSGFVLVGSQAREETYVADQYSDLEAYIIVKDENVEDFQKQLPDLVSKSGQVIFSYKNRWAGFSTVFEDLFRLELPIAKQSELILIFSRPKAQIVKILIDKTNGQLKKTLNDRPQTIDYQQLFQDQVEDFWYMVIVAVQYFKKGEVYNSRSALQILISSLIKLLELLQDPKIVLLETNKRIEQFLSVEQIALLKEVSPAYDSDQIKQSLKMIINAFSNLSKEVADKYNYQYRKDIEDKIKSKLLDSLS